MNYLSVCSGIEAATVAWHDMGWNPVGFSEIEKFPSQLLAHHYPNVTNYGDMTKFKEWNINEPVNLLVGGTPCQSFSVAGLRKGLADPRGNLMLTYLAMADHFKPKWLLWENVPGVLSSNGGHDFAALLQGLAELGYGFAYRVLDAQHFGVPQRRRRVFVVGCLGDWRSAAKVLFESESLCGDITPSRSKGQEIANCLTKSPASHSSYNPARSEGNAVIAPYNTAGTLLARDCKGIDSYDYTKMAIVPVHARDGEEVLGTLTASYGTGGADLDTKPLVHNVAHAFKVRGGCAGGGKGYLGSDNTAFTLSTVQDQQIAVACLGGQHPNAAIGENIAPTLTSAMGVGGGHVPLINSMRVRRLTPMECERLQGFPDNYTNTPTSSDSTRYKALGNSMAVPVMRWIGNRINNV
jgi:DNA (cytosine-5)-methyltransferase 1